MARGADDPFVPTDRSTLPTALDANPQPGHLSPTTT